MRRGAITAINNDDDAMPTSSSSSSSSTSSSRVFLSRRVLLCRPKRLPCEAANLTSTARRLENVVRYTDCRRNHAAAAGGHVVDGCMEFMPSGEDGTVAALICAACGCHRSFHRRQVVADCCSNSSSPR